MVVLRKRSATTVLGERSRAQGSATNSEIRPPHAERELPSRLGTLRARPKLRSAIAKLKSDSRCNKGVAPPRGFSVRSRSRVAVKTHEKERPSRQSSCAQDELIVSRTRATSSRPKSICQTEEAGICTEPPPTTSSSKSHAAEDLCRRISISHRKDVAAGGVVDQGCDEEVQDFTSKANSRATVDMERRLRAHEMTLNDTPSEDNTSRAQTRYPLRKRQASSQPHADVFLHPEEDNASPPPSRSKEQNNPRRKYTYVNRPRAPAPKPSLLRAGRESEAANVDNINFEPCKCCKRLRCFQTVDMKYFRAQRKILLKASQAERKQTLVDMLSGDKNFVFNNRKVCSHFLQKGFRFSKNLQRSVKGTEKAPATPLIHRLPKMDYHADRRDGIISFLQTLASSAGEQMPDSSEQHLPFHQKTQVYEMYCRRTADSQAVGIPKQPASFSYFVCTWNSFVKGVKVRAVKRFTKCTECETTRAALVAAVRNKAETADILRIRKRHLAFIQNERASYLSRSEIAITNPERACSIVVDGADQTDFGLPHFTVNTKDTRGEALKVKLVGLLEHGAVKRLYLYTLTSQFETGANHIVECIHRWLNRKATGGNLPPCLFVQVDNCSRENKNRFMFSYFECLVSWGVFEEVQASFLPIGHTHTDIDQTFSCTSKRLKVHDAITMEELHKELKLSYTPSPIVNALNHVANFSGLLQREKCVRQVPPFTQFRFFKFTRNGERPRKGTGRYKTFCSVKVNCDEEWESLGGDVEQGFIKFAPDLSKTPMTKLHCAEDVSKVTERIESEEGRINDVRKIKMLKKLRDTVFTPRDDPFHWTLEDCVEYKAAKGENVRMRVSNDDTDLATYVPQTKLSYRLNSFVIVKPERPTQHCPFWLAQVMNQHKNRHGDIAAITVRWYEIMGESNVFDGVYKPRFTTDNRNNPIPWTDKLSTDTVMFVLDSLTCQNKLSRISVRRVQLALQSQTGE